MDDYTKFAISGPVAGVVATVAGWKRALVELDSLGFSAEEKDAILLFTGTAQKYAEDYIEEML